MRQAICTSFLLGLVVGTLLIAIQGSSDWAAFQPGGLVRYVEHVASMAMQRFDEDGYPVLADTGRDWRVPLSCGYGSSASHEVFRGRAG